MKIYHIWFIMNFDGNLPYQVYHELECYFWKQRCNACICLSLKIPFYIFILISTYNFWTELVGHTCLHANLTTQIHPPFLQLKPSFLLILLTLVFPLFSRVSNSNGYSYERSTCQMSLGLLHVHVDFPASWDDEDEDGDVKKVKGERVELLAFWLPWRQRLVLFMDWDTMPSWSWEK